MGRIVSTRGAEAGLSNRGVKADPSVTVTEKRYIHKVTQDARASAADGTGTGQPAWRLSTRLGMVGIGTGTGQRITTGRMFGIGTGRRIATGRMIGIGIGTVSRIATGRMRSPDCRPPDRQGRRDGLQSASPGVPTTS